MAILRFRGWRRETTTRSTDGPEYAAGIESGNRKQEAGRPALVILSPALVILSLALVIPSLALVILSLALVIPSLALVILSLALVILSLALVILSAAKDLITVEPGDPSLRSG